MSRSFIFRLEIVLLDEVSEYFIRFSFHVDVFTSDVRRLLLLIEVSSVYALAHSIWQWINSAIINTLPGNGWIFKHDHPVQIFLLSLSLLCLISFNELLVFVSDLALFKQTIDLLKFFVFSVLLR
jgi:hypothetical protein